MIDKQKFEQTIINAYESVIKRLNENEKNNAAMLKKKELYSLVSDEPGANIGTVYSNFTIAQIIRKHLKNKK